MIYWSTICLKWWKTNCLVLLPAHFEHPCTMCNQPPHIWIYNAGALFCMSFFIPWYRLCPVFCCLFWFFFYVLKDEGNVHICYIFGLSLKYVFLSLCISPILKLKRKSAKKDKTLSNNFVMLETKIKFCFRNGIK